MKNKPTFTKSFMPLIFMFLTLGIGFGYFKLKIEILLITSAIFAGFIARTVGIGWDDIQREISTKIGKAMPAILILITVGMLIGTWMISGTIPMLIYYGIKTINPSLFLVTAFFVTSLVSVFTGTSWGSAGTIGVALMGIAAGLGISLPAAAGAVISGAYFGDKLSPLSDTTNLAPIASGCTLYEHIQHMLYTTLPATAIAFIVYFIAGRNANVVSEVNPESVDLMLSNLSTMFNFNILLLLPVLIIIIGSVTKKPTVPVMLTASFTAAALAMIFQGYNLKEVMVAAVDGFSIAMAKNISQDEIIWEVSKLLNRGGMKSMMSMILMIFSAFSFASIMSVAGFLDAILEKMHSFINSDGSLVGATILSSVIMAIVAGTAYLTILIVGELFQDAYKERGLHAKNLSRTLEDSGTVIIPLVPWSAGGVYMATTLGVSTFEYFPWAILCYTGIIFAMICAATGIGIAKIEKKTDDIKTETL